MRGQIRTQSGLHAGLRVRTWPALAALSLALWLAASGPASAGESGVLRGRVVDQQSRPLTGATVTLRSKSNPAVNGRGTVTNARGQYQIAGLPPAGDYEVSCALAGFATITKRPVRLPSGGIVAVHFVLVVEIIERIEVIEKGSVVETERTATVTTVNREFLAGLPILGRNFSDVLVLAPGVTDTDGDGNPNVKGAREVDFQLRISGVQVNDPFGGGRALDFNIEAIEGIEILTGALSAEYSSQGGVGAVTTRSGGNEFQGSFKVFYQTRSIDGDGAANDDFTHFDQEPPSFRTLRPFATAGGALRKDRLWYFVALEYLDEQEPVIFGAVTRNSSREGHRDFAKLTWQMNWDHKLSFEAYYEPTDTAGNNIAPTIAEESDFFFDSVGRLHTLRDTAIFSPTVFLDSTLSLYTLDGHLNPVFEPHLSIEDDLAIYTNPASPDPVMRDFILRNQFSVNPVSEHYFTSLINRTVQGPFWVSQDQRSEQLTLREDLNFYIDDLWGSHNIKAGIEWQDQDYSEDVELRPLVFMEPARGGGNILNFQAAVPSGSVPLGAERANFAFYIQDAWKPLPNLTITLGARLDRELVHSRGRSVFDPLAEVDEYNRLARLYYADAGAAGSDANARGQIILGTQLNFAINPITSTFFCDLDGDGTCNGVTSADSQAAAGVPGNSDLAVLRGIFSRHNLDCSLVGGWKAQPSAFSGSGRECLGTGDPGKLREGQDLVFEDISLGNTNVAPRFSISYDPFADGRTKLYGTWGRFYGSLFLETVVRERQADFQSFTLRQPDPQNALLREPEEGGFSIYQVSRDLRTPFTDEFTLGFERELAPEFAIKVVYTRRKGRNQLQDVDVNHVTVDRLGGPNGRPDGFFDDCLGQSEGASASCAPDGIPDLEVLNPNFNQIFRIGNVNASSYRSMEVVLTKRLHRNWLFETSYTWSKAEGDAEEFLSALGDDPSQVDLEEGFLDFDQRHVFKFSAVAHLPKEFSLGGMIQYESGLPFSLVRRDLTLDNTGNGLFRTIFPTAARNDQRNRAYWTFNVNLKKGFTFGGRVKAVASLDIFDLLNTDELRIFSLNVASASGLQISDPSDPATRQFGRRFQFGLELHF
ncbi:MAG: TonB-dependent receptor [Acidobacteriota bacterium]